MSEQDIKELWERWMKNKINNMKEEEKGKITKVIEKFELLKWSNKLVTMWAESPRHIYSFSRLVPEERMIELLEELQKITK